MLCLTRRRNEECVIGTDIRVTVVELRPDCVRLGIEAPRALPVNRREILESRLRDGEVIPSVGGLLTQIAVLQHENERLRSQLERGA